MNRELWRSDDFLRFADTLGLECPCCHKNLVGANSLVNSPFLFNDELHAPTLPLARVHEVDGKIYSYTPSEAGYPVLMISCAFCGHMSLFDLTTVKKNYLEFLAEKEHLDEESIQKR